MFSQKIKNRTSGILIYGITPPKLNTPAEKVVEHAERTITRIQNLPIDALIVYDVQDESARTKETRPFPFTPAIDPLLYTSTYLATLTIPKIIYRPAGKYSAEELTHWFKDLQEQGCHPILVGVPSPDYVPKISLQEAYQIWSKFQHNLLIGAISIPERHAVLKDEDQRMLDKIRNGVSYFVTQCVFNVDYSIHMLQALKTRCSQIGVKHPTIIFTLSTCGSVKTLEFMEWLGIHFSEESKEQLLASENILNTSADMCLAIAKQLSVYCTEQGIPFGFNIESVAIRKEEVEASIDLVYRIDEMLTQQLLSNTNTITH